MDAFEHVEEKIKKSNILEAQARQIADLEQKNRDLETSINKEFEIFFSAVSHDLRAPLRIITSFSQLLIKKYAEQFDENGKQYLRYVGESAQQMEELIEGLLAFAQVTRDELYREKVDLSQLAHDLIARLQNKEIKSGRQVDFVVEAELSTNADLHLLEIVLENLLSNAWKFTSKNVKARIEIGQSLQGDVSAFFVRDNGAGFNMAYVGKLFGPFQRLHTANEFPGQGIGLATVQRILHRHGGRIWAEGQEGIGATFYFTLA